MSKPITIAADENIEGLEDLLPETVVLERFVGRRVDTVETQDLIDRCDALLVRSITPVNESLLKNASPKFVGSTTIGTDHIDLKYLSRRGIPFASAPGSNANAVVDYVAATLFSQFSLHELLSLRIGVIGVGNVGRRLCRCLSYFGLSYQTYDPWVVDENLLRPVSFNELLESSDAISIHVPYTPSGDHPTHHLINDANVDQLKSGALIINTSRGDVIDETAVIRRIERAQDIRMALDVWHGEPRIYCKSLNYATVATPHIAGYSALGRQRAAAMVVDAMWRVLATQGDFGVSCRASTGDFVEQPLLDHFSYFDDYRSVICNLIDLPQLDSDFREAMNSANIRNNLAAGNMAAQQDARVSGESFDRFRRQYVLRGEVNYE